MVMELRKVWHRPFWLSLLFVLLVTSYAAFAQQRSFTFDPPQTRVDFTLGDVLHTVHGEFRLKRGTIQLDSSSGTASGELVVDATSGDSGNLRTASTTINGPDGVPAQVTSRYNAGNGAATVAFPLPGFNYAYALPPTAAVTFATWPAS